MALNLYQLRAFFTVAQTLNYTEAARRLYVTQSAVSHSVAALSESVKDDLFTKTGGKLALTEPGKILYKSCELVFYELERAEERLAAVKGRNIGTIRLGATVEFGTTLLVKYMKGFIIKNPGVHIDFQFRNELLKPLLNDELDMAIDCKAHKAEGLERTPLFREEYAVIASPDFLRCRRVRKPADLSGCVVLSMDKAGSWWGNFLNALPPEERPAFGGIMELNHIRGIINAAMEGLGVGFVPRYCVLKEFKAGTLVNVFPRLKLLEDNFYVYQRSGRAGLERHRNLLLYLKNIRTTQLERA
jgi:DNA-binding transcriptional LysR family regulator